MSLVGRAVRAARRFLAGSGERGRVVVDTDCQAIACEGRRWGAEVPFLRAAALAADATPMIDNVLAMLERLSDDFAAVVLLQPTSPLRTAEDIAACWRVFDANARPSVLSVTAQEHAPEHTLRLEREGVGSWAWPQSAPESRRQDLPRSMRPSGAVYVNTPAFLRKERRFFLAGVTRGVELPRDRSIDVDTADDLLLAELIERSRGVSPLVVGARAIGPGTPCFVIAEAGVNHGGDVAIAHRLVDAAADAHADAVKFQTFDPERLVAQTAAMADYQMRNTGRAGTQAEMLRALVLPREAHAALQSHATQRGLIFLSTPFDEGSADFLESLGVPAFKMASGELTNHPFLRHVASKGRPLLLSTGMADMHEVAMALEAVESAGNPPVGLFHCVTNYPADASDANLLAMSSMRAAFGRPVGWSDHTLGAEISLAAVAAGAVIIEKHFTLDRSMAGPDHAASLSVEELASLVRGIRAVESSIGTGVKRPQPSELPLIAAARKSLHARHDLARGQSLLEDDLVALRPGDGIAPSRLPLIIGRTVSRAVAAGAKLDEEDLV